MMSLEEFRKDLLESVRSSAEANRNFIRASFVEEMGERLVGAEELAEFQSCRFEGVGSGRKKVEVDGYSYDELDNSVSLVVVDFSNDDEVSTFGVTDTNRLFRLLRQFVEESFAGELTDGTIEESQPGYGLASDILSWRPVISRFRFYLVSDRQLNTKTKDWPEEAIEGIPTEFHIWDVVRFFQAHESATGRDELKVNFSEFGHGVPCLKAGHAAGEYDAYLCMISGDALAGIYERYGSRLLEGNVRSFLSAKGKVNSGIQGTIRSNPEMFFAYNNGITATAEGVEVECRSDGVFITEATNLQIVNGAQTTASLAASQRKDGADLSQIFVQMKLAVLPPERAGELIPDIARYANSQNKVSDADFFANHPYHVRVEEFSRRIWAPGQAGAQHGTHWFYERARGQYLNEQAKLSKAQRAQFQLQNPKRQMLAKTDVAKLENTWRGLPHKVSLGAQKNFTLFAEWIAKRWKDDEKQFHEEYFKELIALAILFKHAETLVSEQPWYQGGYRANVVTYSLAKLRETIVSDHLGKQLDLRSIWDRQAVSNVVSMQLASICRRVFEVLTSSSRPKENVTEWAKMEACWAQVQAIKLKLDVAFVEQLVDVASSRGAKKEAATRQNIDNSIAVQMSVVGIAGRKWAEIRTWGEQNGLLTEKEREVLKVASMIPSKLPSDKQCQLIWQVRTKLIDAGCPG